MPAYAVSRKEAQPWHDDSGPPALGRCWGCWRAERPWVPLLAQRALLAERQRERDRLAERVKALEQRAAPLPGDPH